MQLFMLFLLFVSSFTSVQLLATPAQVIIIRQAEKNANDKELSIKGRERAAALVHYFLDTPELNTFKTPVAIYASIPSKPDTSQRSIDTVRPLADFLKIAIRDTYEANDYKKMADEIKTNPSYNGKTVLICWEHSYIPELARAFGALQTPATWGPNTYDRTWVITLNPNGKASFQNFPQRLMFGDSST